MDISNPCNFFAITLWFEVAFAAAGWGALILAIVFLSIAIHHEKSRRKQARSDLLVARTTRPRAPYAPPTPTKLHTPPAQPPVRPTDLPIREPYSPQQAAMTTHIPTPVDQVRMIMPPPTQQPPRNFIAPNAFTYLPNGVLNPSTQDNFLSDGPPTSGWSAGPPPVAPRASYVNAGYDAPY